MEYSKIALGSVQFGMQYGISNQSGQTSDAQISQILHLARELGIHTIDTASAYGDAERNLGKNYIAGFKIVSKFMPPNGLEGIFDQLTQSLQNLKREKLYGYLAHRPMDVVKNKWQWKELLKLRENGLIEKIGFSVNHKDEITQILSLGMKPDIIQAPYNFFDKRFESNLIELKKNGCEIFTRSTFLQGLFFMNINSLSSFFDEIKPIIHELQNNSLSLAGDLLKHVLDKPFIDKVIIGVENIFQLKNNIEQLLLAKELPAVKLNVNEQILMPSLWPKE